MDIEVLFEDQDTLVINKPVGVVVNRAESIKGETIQDWAEGRLGESLKKIEEKTFRDRSGICHRLDKETSGSLMIAKNPKALKYYLKVFKDRKIEKKYVALVHGMVQPRSGGVCLPLKRSLFDREKWQVRYDGKKAITEWEVKKYFVYPGREQWRDHLTYLELNLKTGRTHQIRVHLSFLGWPIFADDKYLNYKQAVEDRSFLKHHFLHAQKLSFKTFLGEDVFVEAPLPEDCRSFLWKIEEE